MSFYRAITLCVLLLAPLAVSGQELPPPPPPPPQAAPIHVAQPVVSGTPPVPQPAIKAIFDAYSHYEVVAMGAGHGNQTLDSFILSLLSDPRFPGRINDIVVECGNSLYQPILDRYIAGDKVDLAQVQKVWRNTTQPMCAVSAFYQQLFPLIRRTNQRLPHNKRVRISAGDVPINWEAVRTRTDLLRSPQDRDGNIAAIMQRDVLSRHRKALMLLGIDHLYHGPITSPDVASAVALYERTYPGVTLVVDDHEGFGDDTPYARFNGKFESRLASWPIPSLVMNLKGTWLADVLDKTRSLGVVMSFSTGKDGKRIAREMPVGGGRKFATIVDAYLYLGPRDLLLNEPVPANILLDKPFMAEMHRRAMLMGPNPVYGQADPDKVAKTGYDPFLYGSAQ